MSEEFYRTNDILTSFKVMEDGEPAKLTKARVSVLQKKEWLFSDQARVSGNEVSYIIKEGKLPSAGRYTLNYDFWVKDNYGTRKQTHPVNIIVKELLGRMNEKR